MTKKDFYTPPKVDVFTVQTEGVVCASVDGGGEITGITEDAFGDLDDFFTIL